MIIMLWCFIVRVGGMASVVCRRQKSEFIRSTLYFLSLSTALGAVLCVKVLLQCHTHGMNRDL